jgi:hypothetical protein
MKDERLTLSDKAWIAIALLGFAAMCAIYYFNYASTF